MKLVLVLIPFLALTTRAEDDSLMTMHRIETETADHIQAAVLNPILGAGQSSVFVKLKLEVKREYELSGREGEGQSTKISSKETDGLKQTQESRQTKGVKEERFAMSNRYTAFRLVILHDAKVPPGKIAAARSALLAVYKQENLVIHFHPVEFSALK